MPLKGTEDGGTATKPGKSHAAHSLKPIVRLNERFSQSSVATKPIGKKHQRTKMVPGKAATAAVEGPKKLRKRRRPTRGGGGASRRRSNRRPGQVDVKSSKTTEELDMDIDQYMKERQASASS